MRSPVRARRPAGEAGQREAYWQQHVVTEMCKRRDNSGELSLIMCSLFNILAEWNGLFFLAVSRDFHQPT